MQSSYKDLWNLFERPIKGNTWVYKILPGLSFIFNRKLRIADHYLTPIWIVYQY